MATLQASPSELRESNLRGQKLPNWTPWAIGAGAIVVSALIFAVTGDSFNRARFAVLAALLFVVALTAASFAVEGRRQATDRLFTTFVYSAFVLAIAPLISIIYYTLSKGLSVIDGGFLTHSMFTISEDSFGGGAYHAIIGTLIVTGIATVFAVPIGVLTAVYLVEYGEGKKFARLVSFFVDVMTGIPSIVAGLFIFTFWLLTLGFQKSGFAGALSLVILMLPVIVRSTEEILRLVPHELREASYALGVPKWKTIVRVVLPTAFSGIVTGVMLAIARAMGETAPLLLLVGTQAKINFDPTSDAMSTLPTFIYSQLGSAAGNADAPGTARAWGAAVTLIAIIMVFNLLARFVGRFTKARG
ncbi:phosphate ABC transporter permease PstA [Cryptosporangium minutisporangium]|uniref:Phosphate transport system permease protein PstA n=1 Tax=Cryptosporangium minutisporangium TaxID=113569 RepID=A0ABP6T983_9ACTN